MRFLVLLYLIIAVRCITYTTFETLTANTEVTFTLDKCTARGFVLDRSTHPSDAVRIGVASNETMWYMLPIYTAFAPESFNLTLNLDQDACMYSRDDKLSGTDLVVVNTAYIDVPACYGSETKLYMYLYSLSTQVYEINLNVTFVPDYLQGWPLVEDQNVSLTVHNNTDRTRVYFDYFYYDVPESNYNNILNVTLYYKFNIDSYRIDQSDSQTCVRNPSLLMAYPDADSVGDIVETFSEIIYAGVSQVRIAMRVYPNANFQEYQHGTIVAHTKLDNYTCTSSHYSWCSDVLTYNVVDFDMANKNESLESYQYYLATYNLSDNCMKYIVKPFLCLKTYKKCDSEGLAIPFCDLTCNMNVIDQFNKIGVEQCGSVYNELIGSELSASTRAREVRSTRCETCFDLVAAVYDEAKKLLPPDNKTSGSIALAPLMLLMLAIMMF